MLMLRNLFNITKNKLVLGGQKGQYMGQNSPNKLFITTMADDLKKTEPLQKQTPITPPIKSAKPAIAPRPIPPKPIIPSQPKPIIPPQPIIPKPIVPSQLKPIAPLRPMPPKPTAPLFSAPPKPAIRSGILTQPKEKPIIAKTSPINIPKIELPKQKIIPNIPDDILMKTDATKPNRGKILIAVTTVIIIIAGISGYYYWPTTPNVTEEEPTEFDPTNIPQRKLIKLIDNNNIYYITEVGAKRLIPNETILNSYPLNQTEAIITVSQEEFDYYPENIFIKLPADPKIYKLENGQKRWLKNEDASKNPDFDWSKVAPVNQIEFDYYPEGAPIE